jgi:glycosyltransferase involved in cell wall biosynthesis
MTQPLLSVVLPCYNEEKNLPLILERYAQVAPPGLDWELILVENGSQDASAAVLRDLLARPAYAFARSVSVALNRGYGFGMAAGLRSAKGKVLAFSHADMQCDPRSLFEALEAYEAAGGGKLIVKGKRQGRAAVQELVTGGMSLIATVCLQRRLQDINAQPKLFPAALLKDLGRMPDGFEFDVYVLYRALLSGHRLLTIPVVFAERAHGQSKWAHTFASRWRTMLRVALYILKLRFSSEPLL